MSNEVFEQLKEKAEGADAIGGTLKFEVGDLIVFRGWFWEYKYCFTRR
jgi:hypothetical protein